MSEGDFPSTTSPDGPRVDREPKDDGVATHGEGEDDEITVIETDDGNRVEVPAKYAGARIGGYQDGIIREGKVVVRSIRHVTGRHDFSVRD